MSSALDVRVFARDALEQLGCLVEAGAGDSLEAVLTPPVAQAMKVPEMVRLSFEPGRTDGVPLEPGQPAMDGLLDLCTGEPVVAHQILALPDRTGRAKALAAVQERLSFPNARPAWGDEGWGLSRWMRCGFLASFISDERRDLVEQVVFDLTRGCVVEGAPEGEPGGHESWVEHACWPVPTALSRCAQVAMERLQKRVASWLRRCSDRAAVDQSRARDYFETLDAELRRRLRSAQQRQVDTQSIETKLANLQAEAERRQRDLTEKHEVRSVLKIAVFHWIEAPRCRVPVTLSNRYATSPVNAWYNPYSRSVDAPACQRCSTPTSTLWLCNQGHVVCDGCAVSCSTCRRVQCRDCGMADCPRCRKPWCETCQRVKPGCKTCGTVQCENCAATGSCHQVKASPRPAPEQPPVPAASRLELMTPVVRGPWRLSVPDTPWVRATTTDDKGWMSVSFNVLADNGVPTVGVRWNAFSGKIDRIVAHPMRQAERRALHNSLLPTGTSWMELQWPYPAVIAAFWLKITTDERLTRLLHQWFPLLVPHLAEVMGPPGGKADATLWELDELKSWRAIWPEEIPREWLRHPEAHWSNIVRACNEDKWTSWYLYRQLNMLLLAWACAPSAPRRELDVLDLACQVRRERFNHPVVQGLLRRTLGLVRAR